MDYGLAFWPEAMVLKLKRRNDGFFFLINFLFFASQDVN